MRNYWPAILALTVCLLATPALAEKRVALVIGNSSYDKAGLLPNPANDAEAVADTLGALGFEVLTGTDLDEEHFVATLDDFAKAVSDADVSFFYFAGHGMQFEQENYLLPTDARLESQFAVRRELISLDEILTSMQSVPVSLVFIDACRNNPLSEELSGLMTANGRSAVVSRGLAPVKPSLGDTLVAFAAAPGAVAEDGIGEHSPFTSALIRHLPTRGVEISTILKRVTRDVRDKTQGRQNPEQLTAMASEFYMAGRLEAVGNDLGNTNPDPDPIIADLFDMRAIETFVAEDYLGGDLSDRSHLARIYGATLSYYYGRQDVAKADVIEDKLNYARKWTSFSYSLTPGSFRASPQTSDSDLVDVLFGASFVLESDTKTVTGRTRGKLTLVTSGIQPRIILEDSVIETQDVATKGASGATFSVQSAETGTCPAPTGNFRVVDVASTDSLNLRAGPGTNHDVLGTLAFDAEGISVETCALGWCQIDYGCLSGFVSEKYISSVPVKYYHVIDHVPPDMLNVRSGPSTDYQIVGRIPHDGRGVRVYECQTQSGYRFKWCDIAYNGISGWAYGRYLADDFGANAN